jgi:hypothetical protein
MRHDPMTAQQTDLAQSMTLSLDKPNSELDSVACVLVAKPVPFVSVAFKNRNDAFALLACTNSDTLSLCLTD